MCLLILVLGERRWKRIFGLCVLNAPRKKRKKNNNKKVYLALIFNQPVASHWASHSKYYRDPYRFLAINCTDTSVGRRKKKFPSTTGNVVPTCIHIWLVVINVVFSAKIMHTAPFAHNMLSQTIMLWGISQCQIYRRRCHSLFVHLSLGPVLSIALSRSLCLSCSLALPLGASWELGWEKTKEDAKKNN